MCFNWFGSSTSAERINFGSLAVIAPIFERMDLAGILDRHLPKDPQAEFSAGSILSLLAAARLADPVALVNVADWAQQSGADLVWQIPPEKLNDDRLGRALDDFYYQRHSILAGIALHVAETFDLSLRRLHYDPTAIFFHGAYASSQPRDDPTVDLQRPWANDPPAHITFGHAAHDRKIVHAGVSVAIDAHGAVPIFVHASDGNHNGHTAIAEQFDLLQEHAHSRPAMPPVVTATVSLSSARLLGTITAPCMMPTARTSTGNPPATSPSSNNGAASVLPLFPKSIMNWPCCTTISSIRIGVHSSPAG